MHLCAIIASYAAGLIPRPCWHPKRILEYSDEPICWFVSPSTLVNLNPYPEGGEAVRRRQTIACCAAHVVPLFCDSTVFSVPTGHAVRYVIALRHNSNAAFVRASFSASFTICT